MKRSEMLEKMVFSMELHAGNDPAWLDSVPGMKAGALDYADKILRDLEDCGMLPPAVEDSIKIEEGKDGELFIPIWKWENE